MARRESKAQKNTIERVMHEYKHGELPRGRGGKVKSRKQAVAIALREAGASKYQSPKKNRENLRKTKSKESRGQTALAEREGRKTLASKRPSRKRSTHNAATRRKPARKTSTRKMSARKSSGRKTAGGRRR